MQISCLYFINAPQSLLGDQKMESVLYLPQIHQTISILADLSGNKLSGTMQGYCLCSTLFLNVCNKEEGFKMHLNIKKALLQLSETRNNMASILVVQVNKTCLRSSRTSLVLKFLLRTILCFPQWIIHTF